MPIVERIENVELSEATVRLKISHRVSLSYFLDEVGYEPPQKNLSDF